MALDGLQKYKVFISYSRSESRFADELVAGLEYDGQFDATIDRQSIAEGENWKLRLGALIAEADSVVFVISPRSAKSKVCAWEVSHARKLGKRLVPVLAVATGKIPVPKELAALNYVRFDPLENGEPRSFMAGLNSLVRALHLDIEWLNDHTRYLTLAQSWEESTRAENRLLSGLDIAEAKTWLAQRPKDAPEATSLQLDFIKASEQEELRRASREQAQIEEIRQAQDQRELAITNSKIQATRMRMASFVAATLGIGLLVGTLIYASKVSALRAEQLSLQNDIAAGEMEKANLESSNEKLESKLKETTRLIRIVESANDKGLAGLRSTCDEAIETTARMTRQTIPNAPLKKQFDNLYYGPMLLVEYMQSIRSTSQNTGRTIEKAMVEFGRGYDVAVSTGNGEKLCQLAFNVEKECALFLNSICKPGTPCKKPLPVSKC